MRYKVYYQVNGKVKIGFYDSYEEFTALNNIIKVVDRFKFKNIFQARADVNIKDILVFSKQLQTLLNAKISIGEALDMIAKSEKSKCLKDIIQLLLYSVQNNISTKKSLILYQQVIPADFIVFFDLGLKSGNINASVDAIVKILEEKIMAQKKLQEILRYPLVLLVSLISAFWMIFEFVLPNFESIFNSQKSLALSTQSLLYLNYFIENYFIIFIVSIVSVVYFLVLYIRKKSFLWSKILLLKIPFLSGVYKRYIFYKFFLALSIMVKSKHQMQIALQHTIYLIDNEYMKMIIDKILSEVKNGQSIVHAFESKKIFDDLTIKLLYTAQQSNEFTLILQDLTSYYHDEFDDKLKNFSSLIEPITIIVIALVVLWMVLGIMTPIWDMGAMM